jgi:hypothetical protein
MKDAAASALAVVKDAVTAYFTVIKYAAAGVL